MKSLIFFLSFFIGTMYLNAQDKLITGSVSDKNGDVIIGGTVFNKRTNVGTVTDIDGVYKINASPHDSLVFRYIGHQGLTTCVDYRSTIYVELASKSYEQPSPGSSLGGGISLIAQGTYAKDFGYGGGLAISLPYKLSDSEQPTFGDNLKRRMSLGLELNNIDPENAMLFTSAYLQFNVYYLYIQSIGCLTTFYLDAGYYLNIHDSKVANQNVEYGGGLDLSFLKMNSFSIIMGYKAYNKVSDYNHFYAGLRLKL